MGAGVWVMGRIRYTTRSGWGAVWSFRRTAPCTRTIALSPSRRFNSLLSQSVPIPWGSPIGDIIIIFPSISSSRSSSWRMPNFSIS